MKAIDNIVVKGNISLTDYLYLSVGANDGTRLYGINPSAHANTNGLTVMHMGDDLADYSAGGQAFVFRFGNFTSTSITSDIGSSAGNYIDAMSLKSTATSTLTTIYNALNFDFAKVASGFVRTDASGNISSSILSASDIPSLTVSKLSDFSTSVITLINANNSATTTKLATARTISATGDASWSVSFDGSANSTAVLTLANTGITAGSYATTGSYVPTLSVDSKGRITGISNTIITPAWGNITGTPSSLTKIATNKNDIVGGKNYFGFNKGIITLRVSGTGSINFDSSINGFSIVSTTTYSGRLANLGFDGVNGAFTITAWIYASAATTALINLCDVGSDEYGGSAISITTTPTKFVFTFSSVTSHTGSGYYGFLDIEEIPSGVTVYFKNIKIERGVIPTDYWYALEDHYITDNSTNNINYPVVWDNNNRALFHTASKLTFNPSTGTLNVSGSITEGGTSLTEKYYRFGRYTGSSIDFNSINSSTPGGYQCFVPSGGSYTITNEPNMSVGGGAGFLIQGYGANTYWDTQLFLSSQSDTMQFRTSTDVSGTKTWKSWHTVWHNGLFSANSTWTSSSWQPTTTIMADGSTRTLASWGYSSNDGYQTVNGSFSFSGSSGICNVYADGDFFANEGQYKLYHTGDFTLNDTAFAIHIFEVNTVVKYYKIARITSSTSQGDCFYFKITGGGWSMGTSSITEGYIKTRDASTNNMPNVSLGTDWYCESKGSSNSNIRFRAYLGNDGVNNYLDFYVVLSGGSTYFVAGSVQLWIASNGLMKTIKTLGTYTSTTPSGTVYFDSYDNKSVVVDSIGNISSGSASSQNIGYRNYFRSQFIEDNVTSGQVRILTNPSKVLNQLNSWYNSVSGRQTVYAHYSQKNNSNFFVSDGMTIGGILNIEGSTPGTGSTVDNSKYMPKVQMFGNDIIWTDKSDDSSCSGGGSSTGLFIGDPGVKNNSWTNSYTSLGQTSGPRLTLLGTWGVNIFSNSAPIYIAPINTNAPLNLNTLYEGGITIIGSSSGEGSTTLVYGSQTTISTKNVNINSTNATTISGSAYVNISATNPVNISQITQVITTNFVLPINVMSSSNVGFSRAVNTGVNLTGTNHFYLPSGPADGQMIEFFLCNVSSGSIYIRSADVAYGFYLYNGAWGTYTLKTTTTPINIGVGYGGYLRCVYSSAINKWFIVRL